MIHAIYKEKCKQSRSGFELKLTIPFFIMIMIMLSMSPMGVPHGLNFVHISNKNRLQVAR